ncbi:MAG: hypothetical protein RHS_5395 [Robinsoniella sp. RHS]|nr:MAG: hypothetical protein RHS_5395 [Robinsoniella sp. RHS]
MVSRMKRRDYAITGSIWDYFDCYLFRGNDASLYTPSDTGQYLWFGIDAFLPVNENN